MRDAALIIPSASLTSEGISFPRLHGGAKGRTNKLIDHRVATTPYRIKDRNDGFTSRGDHQRGHKRPWEWSRVHDMIVLPFPSISLDLPHPHRGGLTSATSGPWRRISLTAWSVNDSSTFV